MDESYEMVRRIQSIAAQRERVRDQVTNVQTINGVFKVSGAGEAQTNINFPVKFMERPLINFGAELDPASVGMIGPGSYPSWDVTVSFHYEGPPEKRFFTGALLFIRTTGPTGMGLWIHWSAAAKAVTNPYN